MRRRRSPIVPLGRDAASRFLPVVFGLMVYLAGLALAAVLVLSSAVEQLSQQGIDALTVEVPPDENGETEARTTRVIEILTANSNIAAARPVSDAEVRALLQPWLGNTPVPDDLPLPRLVDVTLAPGARVDAGALAATLSTEVPGVRVDDPKAWLDRLGTFGRSLAVVAGVIVAFVFGATAVMAIVSTRMAIAVHRDVVELLHLMGARDTFIARQFQIQALRVGLIGGIVGAALAAATLVGLEQAAQRLDAALFIGTSLLPAGYAVLAGLPVLAALLATLTARAAALGALRRLP
jgi:cell division transport system permease protein